MNFERHWKSYNRQYLIMLAVLIGLVITQAPVEIYLLLLGFVVLISMINYMASHEVRKAFEEVPATLPQGYRLEKAHINKRGFVVALELVTADGQTEMYRVFRDKADKTMSANFAAGPLTHQQYARIIR